MSNRSLQPILGLNHRAIAVSTIADSGWYASAAGNSDRYGVRAGGGLPPSPVFALTKPKAAIAGTGAVQVQVVCYGTDCDQAPAPAPQSRLRAYAYTESE